MTEKIVLYNPLSGEKNWEKSKQKLIGVLPDADYSFFDITEISDYEKFFSDKSKEADVIVVGGDGTLNRFLNDAPKDLNNEIYFFSNGSGNDFARDVGARSGELVNVKTYAEALPYAIVNGKKYKFVNNVGFGLDGYCCDEAERVRAKGKRPNYKLIALIGLLIKFKPRRAKITVDGVEKEFKKVFLAPSMQGRFYGGGMMMAPDQRRGADSREITLVVLHDVSRLYILLNFPSIYKGTHTRLKKAVETIKGHSVKVEFSSPASVQIDGELIRDVTEYSAFSSRA